MRVYSGSKTVHSEALIVVHFISLSWKRLKIKQLFAIVN